MVVKNAGIFSDIEIKHESYKQNSLEKSSREKSIYKRILSVVELRN